MKKTDLPEHLKQGTRGRLFPILPKSKTTEDAATSILLSVFESVPELLAEILRGEVWISKNAKIKTWSQVCFKNDPEQKIAKNRPDGYLVAAKGKNKWRALFETKIDNDKLNAEQINRYIELAQSNKMDSVITVSNEFVPNITEHPTEGINRKSSKVKIFHVSWQRLMVACRRIKYIGKIANAEKVRILDDFSHFIESGGVGKSSFPRMTDAWESVCEKIGNGERVPQSDPGLRQVSKNLIQEFSEIALILSDITKAQCLLKSINDEKISTQKVIGDKIEKSLLESISKNRKAEAEYEFNKVTENIVVNIDLQKKQITVGMRLKAPEGKSTTKGKINWLKSQLKGKKDSADSQTKYTLEVGVYWKRQSSHRVLTVDGLTPESIQKAENELFGKRKVEIYRFFPQFQMDESRKFKSGKEFIREMESMVKEFYIEYGWKLQDWHPKSPKPVLD